MYHLLFHASAATMLEVAANPKRLGAQIGSAVSAHAWGQNLLLHPHIHCLVRQADSPQRRERWASSKIRLFSAGGRTQLRLSRQVHQRAQKGVSARKAGVSGPVAELSDKKRFLTFANSLGKQKWVVYAKPAFGGPIQVIRDLGRYTHRVAISNHRLLAFDGENVTFRWKDYAHGNKQRKMTVSAHEFCAGSPKTSAKRVRSHPPVRIPTKHAARGLALARTSRRQLGTSPHLSVAK